MNQSSVEGVFGYEIKKTVATRSQLPKILHQHDVTVVTFRQCPQERNTVRRKCQARMTVLGRTSFRSGLTQ